MWQPCELLYTCYLLTFSEHISGTTRPIFTFVLATYGSGSVLLWRRYDTLYASGFAYDVMFTHNEPQRGTSTPLLRVTSLDRYAQANAPAASYWLRRVLDDGGRRD